MAKAQIDTRLTKQLVEKEVAVEEVTLVLNRKEAQAVYHLVNGSTPKDVVGHGTAATAIYIALRDLGFTQRTP